MKIIQGMKLQTKAGKVFEVLDVLPFGRLALGQRKTVSETFRPVVRTWENTQRSIRQQVASGDLSVV